MKTTKLLLIIALFAFVGCRKCSPKDEAAIIDKYNQQLRYFKMNYEHGSLTMAQYTKEVTDAGYQLDIDLKAIDCGQ